MYFSYSQVLEKNLFISPDELVNSLYLCILYYCLPFSLLLPEYVDRAQFHTLF